MPDVFAPAVKDATTLAGEGSAAAGAKTCGTCGHGGQHSNGGVICSQLPKHVVSVAKWRACEFTPSRWVEMTPERKAKREAQVGIDQAVAAAERHTEGWSDTAYAFIKLYCIENKGKRCIGRDIVEASVAKGVIQPPNSKAWGGPIQRASREKLLKRIGFHEDNNRHGAPVPLWEVA